MKVLIAFICVLSAVAHTCEAFEETISMPVVNITKPDTYMCYAVSVEKLRSGSLVGYRVNSSRNIAHHISIAVCGDCEISKTPWECRTGKRGKRGRQNGKNRLISIGGQEGFQNEHAHLEFPDDIGIELGEAVGMKYVLLQVHYKDPSVAEDLSHPNINITLVMTEERRPYLPQKLMLVSYGFIPSQSTFGSELAMKWTGRTIYPYSYYVHVHNYGVMVEGYLIKNGDVSLVGRQKAVGHANPNYRIEKPVAIEYGDIIAARCIYHNNETYPVKFGSRNRDEMCNFGIDFKYAVDDSLAYPKPVVVYQNAQNTTWCAADRIPETNILCERSSILDYQELNNM